MLEVYDKLIVPAIYQLQRGTRCCHTAVLSAHAKGITLALRDGTEVLLTGTLCPHLGDRPIQAEMMRLTDGSGLYLLILN
jgi:hypothetical protein